MNREIKSAKFIYYCDLISEAKGNSNKLWKAVNETLSRKSKSPPLIERRPDFGGQLVDELKRNTHRPGLWSKT